MCLRKIAHVLDRSARGLLLALEQAYRDSGLVEDADLAHAQLDALDETGADAPWH